jgi:hypothetical protein
MSRALALLVAAAACGGDDGGAVVVVRLDADLELAAARVQVAERYYADHADDRDMLVVWDTHPGFFGHVSYLAVANDVAGLGYRNIGTLEDTFDRSADYASDRLQGLIWLGSRWRLIGDEGQPDSALGTLIAETVHRWGAMVHHDDGGGESDRLMASDGTHWSGLVDAGDSPLGGNRWQDLGGGEFARTPTAGDVASDLDLYLMGLLPADQVAPVRLLIDVSSGLCAEPDPCAAGWRDGPPDTVTATAVDVGVAEIVAAEGARTPAAGAAELRQAWIYAVHGDDEVDPEELDRLEQLRLRWTELYGEVTRGLGSVVTDR